MISYDGSIDHIYWAVQELFPHNDDTFTYKLLYYPDKGKQTTYVYSMQLCGIKAGNDLDLMLISILLPISPTHCNFQFPLVIHSVVLYVRIYFTNTKLRVTLHHA